VFQTKVVEKIKTHILCSIIFSPKIVPFLDNVEKYGRTRHATYDNTVQNRKVQFACQIPKARIQTHTHNIPEASNLQSVFCCSRKSTLNTFYSRMWLAIPGLLMSRAWILCASESRLPRAVSSKQTVQVSYYHEFNPHPGPHHLHSFAPATQVSTVVSEKLLLEWHMWDSYGSFSNYHMQQFDLSAVVWV
jgi:hypothetical protein